MSSSRPRIVSVAVPVPLHKTFDFLLPDNCPTISPGTRVKVPFGKRKLIGLVLDNKTNSSFPIEKLKTVIEVLDSATLFSMPLLKTLLWLSDYYLAAIGEVMHTALPAVLRQGADSVPPSEKAWELSEYGRSADMDTLNRAPLQLALVKRLSSTDKLFASDFKSSNNSWRQAVSSLVKKGWVNEIETTPTLTIQVDTAQPVELNDYQSNAAAELIELVQKSNFACSVLNGVTGSGKTEVYFAVMQDVISRGGQVLLLVPEIGLTPQLIQRVERNFSCGVVTLHSGLTDTQRHRAWWHASQGHAGIIIGTRSAVFTPTKSLGLIIIDEEHDSSLKQQDGVRYHARDVAVYRAREEQVSIILGSATPSLESLHNAARSRYSLHQLPTRALNASLPEIQLLDLRKQPTQDGLTPALREAIKNTLAQGQQVMLFLNRRGYAPVLYCKQCGETSQCQRCDSNLTVHRASNRCRCHHCGYEAAASRRCQHCQAEEMTEVGEGTQRVEEALQAFFPAASILRIDRDSTRRKGELEEKLEAVSEHEVDIVLGTQLLAKGHDFSDVTLVGVLGADQGLYSTDFRARETLFQQLMQVAGRAGRRDHVGQVLIQTAFPDEDFFAFLKNHDYSGFSQSLLKERKRANFPPFGFIALIRSDSTHQTKALQLLRRVKQSLPTIDGVNVMDAVPAPMERRAGRHRAQLLVLSNSRRSLHQQLKSAVALMSNGELGSLAAAVRWSIDVDPADLF